MAAARSNGGGPAAELAEDPSPAEALEGGLDAGVAQCATEATPEAMSEVQGPAGSSGAQPADGRAAEAGAEHSGAGCSEWLPGQEVEGGQRNSQRVHSPEGAGPSNDSGWQLTLVPRGDGSVAVSLQPSAKGGVQASVAAPGGGEGSGFQRACPEAAATLAQATAGEGAAGQPAAAAQEQLEQLRALQEERQWLLEENLLLQRYARQYIVSGSKASKQSMADASRLAGTEQRYGLGLQQLTRLVAARQAAEARVQQALAPERERLAAAEAKLEAHRQAFLGFVVAAGEAAKRAAPGAGKAAATEQAVRAFLGAEPAKTEEVRSLRLKNAQLQHQIAGVERKLKDSDRLSDGLHLIDFEQLRIENSTLTYKIEARSGEVLKLRTKLMQTIQMAAHAKEKVHCLEQEKRCLESRLAATEGELQQCRQGLAGAKARREVLLAARAELQRDWTAVTDRRCLADMKAQEAKLAELQAEVARLQLSYAELTAKPAPK